MASDSGTEKPHSWVPWWIDPYSENPIAFGILFLLVLLVLVGSVFLYREIFVTDPGAHPIHEYPGIVLYTLRAALG